MGARDAGIYAAASKTATLVTFVIMAVNAAAAPQFASLWSLGRVEELQQLGDKVRRLDILAFSGDRGWNRSSRWAAAQPLRSRIPAARPALLVLLVGQVINAAAGSVGYLLTLTGHHREADARARTQCARLYPACRSRSMGVGYGGRRARLHGRVFAVEWVALLACSTQGGHISVGVHNSASTAPSLTCSVRYFVAFVRVV